MVVLLACLSILLTLGGGAVAIYGADLIRLESGIALITAGATVFCAGLLLGGLTAVVAELRRMRRLMEIDDNVAPPVTPPAPAVARPAAPEVPPPPLAETPAAPVHVASGDASEKKDEPPPVVAAGAVTPARFTAPEAAPVREAPALADRPPLPPPPPPLAKSAGVSGSGIPAEARAGLVGYPGLSRLKPREEVRERVEPSLDAEPSVVTTPSAEPDRAVEKPSAEHKPLPVTASAAPAANAERSPPKTPEPLPVAPPPEVKPREAKPPTPAASESAASEPAGTGRTMLTSYTSGDVTYFMYSDGSIEADFPDGRRRFGSVDELRHYIEVGEGGEAVPPAAASA